MHDYLRPEALLFPLIGGSVRVGRSEGCDVQLVSPEVSKFHAELLKEELDWRVRDLGSTNGTWVVGGSGYVKVTTVITAKVRLGTEIRFGTVDGLFVNADDFASALAAARPAWKRESGLAQD